MEANQRDTRPGMRKIRGKPSTGDLQHKKKKTSKNNKKPKKNLHFQREKHGFRVSVSAETVSKWANQFLEMQRQFGRPLTKNSSSSGLPGEIPFLRSVFFKGTQVVSMLCRCGTTILTSSAGSQILTVVAPTLAAVMITTPLQSTWSEYRCRGGRLKYVPAFEGGVITNTGIIVWVVDYTSATALSTYNGGVVYDTMKIQPTFKPVEMVAHVEPLPDQDWIPITTTGTIFFYFKAYADATTGIGVSTSYGLYWTELDLEFRGVD